LACAHNQKEEFPEANKILCHHPCLSLSITSQVADALAAAEPYKEQLIKRGVLVVPLPIYGPKGGSSSGSSDGSNGTAATIPALQAADLRWRVTPINSDAW
jgi:hypothetical protein